MAIGTNDLDVPAIVGSKREKVRSLAIKHRELFIKENVDIPKWNPREIVHHNEEEVVLFRPEELYGGADIYIELVTKDFIPVDHKRQLWKWIYNHNYATEYALSDPHPANGYVFHFVSVDELVNVTELHAEDLVDTEVTIREGILKRPEPKVKKELVPEPKEVTVELVSIPLDLIDSDLPMASMTVRDHMAIQEWKPFSRRAWINELITNNPR